LALFLPKQEKGRLSVVHNQRSYGGLRPPKVSIPSPLMGEG